MVTPVEILTGPQYALILLDVQMPGLGGIETTKLLRKRENPRSVPIILVSSGSGASEDIALGYDAGCVEYLTKPF